MKIFLSHASRDKPLVREIKKYLPESLTIWLDEKDLPLGANINDTLKDVIQEKTNLVVLFISNASVSSIWVKKELQWALEKEKSIGGVLVLPVVLDLDAWEKIEPPEFRKKRFIQLQDYSEDSVKSLAIKLEKEIFNWMVSSVNNPPSIPKRLVDFNLQISITAGHIYSVMGSDNPGSKVIASLPINDNDKEKNKQRLGPPVVLVVIANKGQDLEIANVNLKLGNSSNVITGTIFDDVNSIVLNHIGYENSDPIGDFILKTNHKKEFTIRAEVFIEQILIRGLDGIEVEDVLKNKYYAPKDEVNKCMLYLNHYFSYTGLSEFYKDS